MSDFQKPNYYVKMLAKQLLINFCGPRNRYEKRKKIYYYFIDILSKSFSKIAKNAVAVIFLMLHTKLFEHEPHISEKNTF
jgi:hypothetical protein